MNQKRIAICPCDDSNLHFYTQLENSLRKFHSEEELPLIRCDLAGNADPMKWYRATPILASHYLEEYETVIKLDADQIITGPLSDIWEGEFDVAVVLNDPMYPINIWDIAPYFNNGLVVLKSKEFTQHWSRLCMSEHFMRYQFREQDLLNILCSDYHNYQVKVLDGLDFYGEVAKPKWAQARLEGQKIMIDDAQLKVIHFGGGFDPSKGNYRIRFVPEVVKRIEELIA